MKLQDFVEAQLRDLKAFERIYKARQNDHDKVLYPEEGFESEWWARFLRWQSCKRDIAQE